MIIYDLVCKSEHRFEGWFQHREDYEKQLEFGLLSCPVCASIEIRTIPSANRVTKSQSISVPADTSKQLAQYEKAREFANALHDYVEKNFDDVGNQFANEARKIHYGESEERGIRGVATTEEAKELKDEGISVLPMPPKSVEKEKLN